MQNNYTSLSQTYLPSNSVAASRRNSAMREPTPVPSQTGSVRLKRASALSRRQISNENDVTNGSAAPVQDDKPVEKVLITQVRLR